MSLYTADVVEVKFDYDAEQPDELSLHVGDIIRNCKLLKDGWLEGELNGKRGIFPDNFVAKKEITPPPGVTSCVCVCTYVCMYICMYIMHILVSIICTYVVMTSIMSHTNILNYYVDKIKQSYI